MPPRSVLLHSICGPVDTIEVFVGSKIDLKVQICNRKAKLHPYGILTTVLETSRREDNAIALLFPYGM